VSPASGATISRAVAINVSATDNVGVSYVQLFINGALYSTDNTGPYSFLWDTTKYANGSYNLVAYAYDTSGNIGTSSQITVSVGNASSTSPTVNVVSPANGATVGKRVNISATASDSVGISQIQILVDGTLKSSFSSASTLSWTWNTTNVTRGAHTITAKACDAVGNVGTSSITVYK
jgi:hypothetical protein